MKSIMLIAAAANCVLLAGELAARQPARTQTLFACTLENGKTARVTLQADRFTLRVGTARRADLIVSGRPSDGNLFYESGPSGHDIAELRFARGEHSYIVHSSGPTRVAGNGAGQSQLVIFHNGRIVAQHDCRRYAELKLWGPGVPEIPENPSRSPSAWRDWDTPR
jgi:hypothetical protein